MSQQGSLAGRTALITGASRGIGEAIAIAMAAEGAHVILSARSVSHLAGVQKTIEAAGGQATILAADLSQKQEVLQLAKTAEKADILVNNAASQVHLFPITQANDDIWDLCFAVDFWAPLLLIRELGRNMVARGKGSIINISSMVTRRKSPLSSTYGVCKSALESLTQYAALEMAPHGVNVNAIAPGLIGTELVRAALSPAIIKNMTAAIPNGRPGECEEVAALAVWLASDKSAYVNGQIIYIDGGATAGVFNNDGPAPE
jgi:NAD(P)-dependent dehydrogenase (short-subunit alcohol dehydrogenase family)